MEASRIVHAAAGSNRSFWGPGDRYTFLVTGEESGGSMLALECLVGAAGGPPPHRHLAEDELSYVFDGTLSFTAGEATRAVSAGESVFVSRGTTHAYRNVADEDVRMVAVYTLRHGGLVPRGVHAARRSGSQSTGRNARTDRADA